MRQLPGRPWPHRVRGWIGRTILTALAVLAATAPTARTDPGAFLAAGPDAAGGAPALSPPIDEILTARGVAWLEKRDGEAPSMARLDPLAPDRDDDMGAPETAAGRQALAGRIARALGPVDTPPRVTREHKIDARVTVSPRMARAEPTAGMVFRLASPLAPATEASLPATRLVDFQRFFVADVTGFIREPAEPRDRPALYAAHPAPETLMAMAAAAERAASRPAGRSLVARGPVPPVADHALGYAAEPEGGEARTPFSSLLGGFLGKTEDGALLRRRSLARSTHPWFEQPLPASAHSAKELKCLAEGIYFESRGEIERGQAAVAQVILNRVRNPAYPDTICGVVYQNAGWFNRCQFSFACDRYADRIHEPEAWRTAQRIARAVVEGEIFLDEVADSTHYHATYVAPPWRRTMIRLTRIGVHIFYRTRGGGWI